MVNTSKVLTVSYGTFSCTLEGFDDSFDTMKAIAEYFRDLAAEDRYFGAEPPTPDAEMLARIAEREVSRHVEAHNDGGKITLRTALPVADDLSESHDAQSAADEQAIAHAAEQARVAEQAEEARLEEERVAKAAAERAEQRAAKRARIAEEKAAQEAQEAEALKAAEEAAAEKAAQEKQAAEEAAAKVAADEKEAAEAAALEAAEAAARAEAEAIARAEAEALAAAEAEAEAKAIAAQEDEAAKRAEEEDGDSVAAKLARIRAVVGQPKDVSATADFSEDEHAEDIMQGQPGDTDLEDLLEDEPAPATTSNDTISDVMSRIASETAVDANESEAAVAVTETEADPEVAEVVDAPKAPIRARVIKMKREEFEAAIASGDIEEDDDVDSLADENSAEASAAIQNSSLSSDDEDELARELAAVEAELSGLPVDAPQAPVLDLEAEEFEPLEPIDAPAAKGAEDLAQAPDAELDRLMDQTSSELEEPDGKKRRNALGHLRAAVAAARADKTVENAADKVDETLDYRGDLESAVQPRRPVRRLTSETPTAASARPPLKLVAEQRVDAPAPTSEEIAAPAPRPVRPRRVKAGDAPAQPAAADTAQSNIAPEGGSFSEFAEEMGANELPDLLEAAAAYMAYVEGKEQFSRPQLMTKVRMVQEDNFSREDGLRSFGQLLRQGKIEKISGGRFTVSDRISFKPDTRAAG